MSVRFVGIDPATKTGVVALDLQGNVLLEQEIKGVGPTVKGGISAEQLVSLENQLYRLLEPGDEIVIESPAFGTQTAITTGMIHGGIRTMIKRKGLDFDLLNPNHTKKYVGVKIVRGESQKQKKDRVAAAVKELFGYTHKSDNVVDAYIIARVSLSLHLMRNYIPPIDNDRIQIEVVQGLMEKVE